DPNCKCCDSVNLNKWAGLHDNCSLENESCTSASSVEAKDFLTEWLPLHVRNQNIQGIWI
ncbi:hypothetical protein HAX54_008307, partial [Datura stramonium]|nr:hypothetical protein [Datura stramonium]